MGIKRLDHVCWAVRRLDDVLPLLTKLMGMTIEGRFENPEVGFRGVGLRVPGGTGHFESVRVVYDPRRISYANLVSRYFRTVDPLNGGGQFCDHGDQYRTAIFVANAEERRIAEAAKAQAARQLGQPIATLILPRGPFYAAEDYHQDYYRKNPLRYRFYRWNCGRDQRLAQVWGQRH